MGMGVQDFFLSAARWSFERLFPACQFLVGCLFKHCNQAPVHTVVAHTTISILFIAVLERRLGFYSSTALLPSECLLLKPRQQQL
jgi:hypothetical protein